MSILSALLSKLSPLANDSDWIPINSSLVNPAVSLNLVKVSNSSAESWIEVPSSEFIATKVSVKPLLEINNLSEPNEAWEKFLLNCIASPLVIFRFLAKAPVFS